MATCHEGCIGSDASAGHSGLAAKPGVLDGLNERPALAGIHTARRPAQGSEEKILTAEMRPPTKPELQRWPSTLYGWGLSGQGSGVCLQHPTAVQKPVAWADWLVQGCGAHHLQPSPAARQETEAVGDGRNAAGQEETS